MTTPIEIDPPYQINNITIVRYLEFSYEDSLGRTYYSGAESPSEEDCVDCLENKRTPIIYASPEQIAAYRYNIEVGGVDVEINGEVHKFDSTRENRVMWVALAGIAQQNPNFTQNWKTLEGDFVVLTSTDIINIYNKIFNHISLSFSKEAELLENPPLLNELADQNWPE